MQLCDFFLNIFAPVLEKILHRFFSDPEQVLGLDLYPANPFQDVFPSATSCCSASMTTLETQTDEVATTKTPSIQIDEVPVTEPTNRFCIDDASATEPPTIRIDDVTVTEPPNHICIDDVP